MLTFRTVRLVFVLALIVLLGLDQWVVSVHWTIYALLALSLIGMVAYGSAYIGSNFHVKAYCQASGNRKQVAITFDDGPAGETTAQVLDVLKANDVKATFFCIGRQMEQFPEQFKQMVEEGHLVGNHSYSHHVLFDLFSRKRMLEELAATDAIAERLIGKRLQFFRPPYGVTTPKLAKAISIRGYHTIGWNIRTMDTVIDSDQQLVKKVLGRVAPGAIILFHDTQAVTLQSLQTLIEEIRKRGLEIVRLDHLLELEAYA